MATIIMSFESEQQAQAAIERLSQAEVGEVRARVLDSSEPLSYPKTESTSPMITPDMGSVEVRPTETPKLPEGIDEDADENTSASIPTTGGDAGEGADGVQVLVEVDDEFEEMARQILLQG